MAHNCKLCHPGLGIFPIMFAVTVSLTCIVTYIISVSNGDVYKYFPTISDTGGRKPESNVFGLFLSVSSFLGFIVVLIRYVQYQHISEYNEEDHSKLIFMNKIAFVVGIIACVGALLVANYQDRGTSTTGHVVGALGVFGGGVIYCWFQSYLSYRMLQCGMNTRKLCLTRLVLSIFGLIFLLSFLIFFYYATKALNGMSGKKKFDYAQWRSKDPGYALHVVSSVAEWFCAISILAFFLTFNGEFNRIKLGFNVRRHDVNILPFQTSTEEDQSLVYA